MDWKYILIVVILAAVVGGGILTWQYLWAPKEEAKMPDETADWKTYRNEEYGFGFKYPSSWRIIYDAQPDYTFMPKFYLVMLNETDSPTSGFSGIELAIVTKEQSEMPAGNVFDEKLKVIQNPITKEDVYFKFSLNIPPGDMGKYNDENYYKALLQERELIAKQFHLIVDSLKLL